MWKNSEELLNYARQQIQTEMVNGNSKIEITLKDSCSNSKKELVRMAKKLKLKEITEQLREEYKTKNIKSCVEVKAQQLIVCFTDGSVSSSSHSIVWILTVT